MSACGAEKHDADGPWVCTEDTSHAGDHVARGTKGVVYATWANEEFSDGPTERERLAADALHRMECEHLDSPVAVCPGPSEWDYNRAERVAAVLAARTPAPSEPQGLTKRERRPAFDLRTNEGLMGDARWSLQRADDLLRESDRDRWDTRPEVRRTDDEKFRLVHSVYGLHANIQSLLGLLAGRLDAVLIGPGTRQVEAWVIEELDLALDHGPAEGEEHPERTPVGPFPTREAADAWASALIDAWGGTGSWACDRLRTPGTEETQG